MKLLVLSLCFVAAFAAASAEFEGQQALENTLNDLSNEPEEADAVKTNSEGLRMH